MSEKVFKAGEVIFREGELGKNFYQIVEGTAGIYLHYGEADERKLTVAKPGQYFGELAAISAWPRSATVVAEDELKVVEITESSLNSYFAENPDRILSIMKQIGMRIRTVTEEYDEVTAFLKEKQESAAKEKEGFLAKLKKYRAVSAALKKRREYTAEEKIVAKQLSRPANSPSPIEVYKAGQIIFREGDIGNYMYAIQSGSVGVYTNYGTALEKKLTTLYTNAFFGEMGMIDHEVRSATAVVEEDGTTLETIDEGMLVDLFKTNPAEVDMILNHLCNRLRRLTQDYVKACESAAQDA